MTHLFAFNTGFKWFGSLTNLSFRRSSTDKSKYPTKDDADRAAGEPETPSSPPSPSTTDDVEVRPRLPSYVRSSDMYSHMGTMPRQLSKKKDKDKERGSSKNQRKGKTQRGPELGRSQSMRPADHVCESPLMSMLSNQGRPAMLVEAAAKPITTRESPKKIEEEAEEVGAGKQPGDTVDRGVSSGLVEEPKFGLSKDQCVPVEESKVEPCPKSEGTAYPGGGSAERPQSPTADMHQPPCQVVLPMKRGKRAEEQRDEEREPEKKQSPEDRGPKGEKVKPAPPESAQQRETER